MPDEIYWKIIKRVSVFFQGKLGSLYRGLQVIAGIV